MGDRLQEFRDRRAAIARRYDEELAPLGVTRMPQAPGADPITYRYVVRLQAADHLLEALNRRGIAARRPVYRPLHRLLGLGGEFPGSERAHRELVSLPLYPALTDDDAGRVIGEVRRCLS